MPPVASFWLSFSLRHWANTGELTSKWVRKVVEPKRMDGWNQNLNTKIPFFCKCHFCSCGICTPAGSAALLSAHRYRQRSHEAWFPWGNPSLHVTAFFHSFTVQPAAAPPIFELPSTGHPPHCCHGESKHGPPSGRTQYRQTGYRLGQRCAADPANAPGAGAGEDGESPARWWSRDRPRCSR